MAEDVTLDVPVQTDSGATLFRVTLVNMDWEAARVAVRFREITGGVPSGKHIIAVWTDAEATSLMTALNKADLSTNSLQRRAIERAQTDGKLPSGTISGTPD